jgi:hypothetical protein
MCTSVGTAGILSDSFNRLGATNFPCKAVEDMRVVAEYGGTGGIDEGRAMVS